ncbi:MAG: CpsD/CapB family tyrosine-protein kinase [Oscillibacter sp.]|nr:CpsD/CapB family tyrosine-protein kinase [Oscillibacter sp.]
MRRTGKKSGYALRNEEQHVFGKDLSAAAAEAYKLLRTNILFALPDEQKCRVVGVTSASGGEGKSTTALNLAYMLAEAGERVLLIEGDMRLPSISRQLKLKAAPGLSNVLAGRSEAREVLQESGLHSRLQVVSSGDVSPNPSDLLSTKAARVLIENLSEDYDFIVLDLPPVTGVADALAASRLTDGMIIVVRQNYTNRRDVADAMRQFSYVNAKVLGFVMTRTDTDKGKRRRGGTA